ncbi:MAG: C45 family autoproteolytic acyltransferase/hydrolase [Crocinitomicaceae bacterium]
MEPLKEIILEGDAYQKGYSHGAQLKETIQHFVKDGRARTNELRAVPLTDSEFGAFIGSHAAMIEQYAPHLAIELKGLAEGAEISYDEAVLLQVRSEIIYSHNFFLDAAECSTIGIHRNNETMLGQTIDLPGELAPLGHVFRIKPSSPDQPEILMYGFAGLLGYAGLNSSGLSLNINMLTSSGWKAGVPPYLLCRLILETHSVDEAISVIKSIPRASSRCFLISDKDRMVTVEMTPNDYQLIEGDLLYHTNHYLDDRLTEDETLHFLFRNSSIKRLNQLKHLTQDNLPQTAEHLFDTFSDHSLFPIGLCAHSEGNMKRQDTVAGIVMEPQKGMLHARKGHPCETKTNTFQLQVNIHNHGKTETTC